MALGPRDTAVNKKDKRTDLQFRFMWEKKITLDKYIIRIYGIPVSDEG